MSDTVQAGVAAAATAPELSSLVDTLSNTTLSSQPKPAQGDTTSSTLSRRGAHGADNFDLPEGLKRMLANMYDPITNPGGIINAGIADNSLCRTELLEFFLAKDQLKLLPADMTYADRFTCSSQLLEAIAALFNQRRPDWPETNASPLPLTKVEPSHIAIGSGATGILDELFWNLCDEGDGVLLSAPYYNAFDNDLTNRAKARIVEVSVPLPEEAQRLQESLEYSSFAPSTVTAYEEAYQKAIADGINVRVLLLCNPHNPTGTIYPRETVVELAKFAAKYQLHFVSDEIYARSTFTTTDVAQPSTFHSILSIDTLKECRLDPSFVHVVTSASKDFAINGFRLGVLVSQHNPALQRAMACIGLLSQSASPAAALWIALLRDTAFLEWYFAENRRRLSLAYQHTVEFLHHHAIPYTRSNAGFFLMINLGTFCGIHKHMSDKQAREKEAIFVDRLIENRLLISPGTMYHHPIPGWFRFTFSQQPDTLKLTFTRLERAMRVQHSFEHNRPVLDWHSRANKPPNSTPPTP